MKSSILQVFKQLIKETISRKSNIYKIVYSWKMELPKNLLINCLKVTKFKLFKEIETNSSRL